MNSFPAPHPHRAVPRPPLNPLVSAPTNFTPHHPPPQHQFHFSPPPFPSPTTPSAPPSDPSSSTVTAPTTTTPTGIRSASFATPMRMPRIAIFENQTQSAAVLRARENTVQRVGFKHGLFSASAPGEVSSTDPLDVHRRKAKRARVDEVAPLPDRALDPHERDRRCYARKLLQNRTSAEVSRDRNREYVAQLETELEDMERDRDACKDELVALKAQLYELIRTATGAAELEHSVPMPETPQPRTNDNAQRESGPWQESWMEKLDQALNLTETGPSYMSFVAQGGKDGESPDFDQETNPTTSAA